MATKKKKSAKKKAARKKLATKKRTVPKDKLLQENWAKGIVVALLSLIAMVLGCFIIWIVFALWHDSRQVPSAETVQAVAKVEPESLPEPEDQVQRFLNKENPEDLARIEELEVFYRSVVKGFINVMVADGEFYILEVSERIEELDNQILRRFGQGALIYPVWNYHPRGTSKINAQASIREDGTPLCILFIASIKERYDKLQARGATGWQAAFFNFLIVQIEHELEHLAISRFPEFEHGSAPLTIEESIKGEALIWHNTCLRVVSLLAEDDSQPLDTRVLLTYNAWKDGGKQPDSQSWLAYVRHNLVDHKRNKER